MTLSPGTILKDRYRIVRQLGQGGFGAVYRAWDLNLSAPCAVKENFDTSPEATRQFAREASMLANLHHPNLPRVTDHFNIPGQGQYLVMDYVEGQDLQEMLDKSTGPLPVPAVIEWICQACDSLTYLHDQQPPVIHRDIKPANIKVKPPDKLHPQGTAMLVDFGIAKIYDPSRRTTQAAQAVTPGFSPIEQYGQKPTDARTDLYALGATAYALLTGQEPPISIDRLTGTPLPRPGNLNPDISPALESALLKCMQVMREDRYQSAAEFKAALQLSGASHQTALTQEAMPTSRPQSALPSIPAVAPVAPPQPVPFPQPAPAMRRKRRFVSLAVGLVGVIILGIVGTILILQRQPPAATAEPTSARQGADLITPTELLPTEAPTATELPPFDPISLRAPDCSYGGYFQAIEALDRYTIRFTLCIPEVAFLAKIANVPFAIQPSEYLESTGGGGDELLKHPIGTGPYMLNAWDRGSELILTRFEGYWGEPAQSPTLIFRWDSIDSHRLQELQAGNVDAIDALDPVDAYALASDPNLQLFRSPRLNTFYIGMNNTYPPYDNQLVRQAIAMGIDRQRLLANYFPYGTEVASHFTPCEIPLGCVGDPWYSYDPAAARALLAQAGFPNGFQTTLYYRDVVRSFLPEATMVAQDIQAQLLENLNITAQLDVMESATFLDAVNAGSLSGLYLLGWAIDYPDVTDFLNTLFGATAPPQFGDPWSDIINALRLGAALTDYNDRMPYYETANYVIRAHVPMIPVSHSSEWIAFQAGVDGVNVGPMVTIDFASMSVPGQDTLVWMQSAEPVSLYCADESDVYSLRACEPILETLYSFTPGSVNVQPALATGCTPDASLTEWTCTLRQGVYFHDGSMLDANDVAMSFIVQWDASSPYHVGNQGYYEYWQLLWGNFLNSP